MNSVFAVVVVVLGFWVFTLEENKLVESCIVVVVVVVLLVFEFFTVEEKNSRILHYCCCGGGGFGFWVLGLHCWRQRGPEFCASCCCCCGVFGFSVFTTVRGFFFPVPSFLWFSVFRELLGWGGFFFCACKCLLHSISSSSFCIFVVWVSVCVEQHSLCLLPNFVSRSFIHSFTHWREGFSPHETRNSMFVSKLSLFLSGGQQHICRWVLMSVSIGPKTTVIAWAELPGALISLFSVDARQNFAAAVVLDMQCWWTEASQEMRVGGRDAIT